MIRHLILLLFILPLAVTAQNGSKILVVTPSKVGLNGSVLSNLNTYKIKPDSLVQAARKTFANDAKPGLTDFTVYVVNTDSVKLNPTHQERTARVKVKRKNLITRKEKVHIKKFKYTGVVLSAEDNTTLQALATRFDYDYVVFISLFEVRNGGFNIAFKPLSKFKVHYEVYNKKLAYLAGNIIADELPVTSTMQPQILFNYVHLSAENVYKAMTPNFN